VGTQDKVVALNRCQLLKFAKQIYAMGATGYLDLIESACEQAVENLIASSAIKSTPADSINPYYDMFQCVVSNYENSEDRIRSFEELRGINYNNTVANLVYMPEEEAYMRNMADQENFIGNNSERI
jgi:hypothetical protein